MQKEFGKESGEEENTEDVLSRLQKEKKTQKIKKRISITIILIILGIIIFLGVSYLSYKYWKSPEVQLKLGAEIEKVAFSENGKIAYIKLKGGTNFYNITKVKFSFSDENGDEHFYETREGISEIEMPYTKTLWDYILGIFGKKPDYSGSYNYDVSSDEIGIENFDSITDVSVLFEYETGTGQQIETPKLDTEKPVVPKTTTGGGGGGSGPSGNGESGCTLGAWIDTTEYRCSLGELREIKQIRTSCPSGTEEQWTEAVCDSGYECQNGICVLQTTGLYEGLVAYYKFEGNANDETGVNNGNLINNAQIINDTDKGNVLSLDGDNDYVDAGNSSSLNLQGALTLSAWVKPNSFEGGKIIDKGWHNVTSNEGNDWEYPNQNEQYVGGFSFDVKSSWLGRPNISSYVVYGGWVDTSEENVIELNKWQHVVLVWNRSGDGNISFFINGMKKGTRDYSGAHEGDGNPRDSAKYNLTIGIRKQNLYWYNISNSSQHLAYNEFNGSIDEVMIYSRALNESEILQIYEAQKPVTTCTNDSGCSSVGSFCEGSMPFNCSLGSDGCLDRVNGTACGSGYYCDSGECIAGNVYYVREGATGGGNGSDWTNAYTTLPASLKRGAAYYITDGNYSSYIFDDVEDGNKYIYIKKAITSYHGTDAGWQNSYGDGIAQFNSRIWFRTSYWIFDGQIGGGPGSWDSGHGFKIKGNTPDTNLIGFSYSVKDRVDFISIKHVELEHLGLDTGTHDDGIYSFANNESDSDTNINISYCYLHDFGGIPIYINYGKNWTFEYNYITRNSCYPVTKHSDGLANVGSDNIIIRYNIWSDIEGTAFIANLGENVLSENWEIYGNIFSYTDGNPYNRIGVGTGIIGGALETRLGNNIKFYNNVVVNIPIGKSGIFLYNSPLDGNEVYNNLWYKANDTNSVNHHNVTHDYNVYINTSLSWSVSPGPNDTVIREDIDPFVDWKNKDFRLKAPTAPGINFSWMNNKDMFGNLRGADGNWDRGAIEYVEGGAPSQNTFYVSVSGGTAPHNGSIGHAFNLSQAQAYANNHTNEEITFLLASGNYGNVVFSGGVSRSGWDKKVTWKSENTHEAVFTRLSISGNYHRYLEFNGIKITPPAAGGISTAAIRISASDYLRFINLDIRGTWDEVTYGPGISDTNLYGSLSDGIYVTGSASYDMNDIIIEDCNLQDLKGGITFANNAGTGTRVVNCTLHHLSGSAIYLAVANKGTNGQILIEGNHVYNQQLVWSGTTFMHASGIDLRTANVIVRGNIVHNFGGTAGIKAYQGVFPETGYTDMLIENNLVYDSFYGTPILQLVDVGSNFIVRNNTIIGYYEPGADLGRKYYVAMLISFASSISDGSGFSLYNNVIVGRVDVPEGSNDQQYISTMEEGKNIIWCLYGDESGEGGHGWDINLPSGSTSKVISTRFNTFPGYTEDYFEGSGNFFAGGAEFDLYSYTRPAGKPHGVNLNDVYYPVMTSDACNGNVTGQIGVAVGALPCVCTNNSQCSDLRLGDCDETSGRCSGLLTLSPFAKLWNFLKYILSGETGKAILTGKITGNAVNENGEFKVSYIILSLLAVIILIVVVIIVKIKKTKKKSEKKFGKRRKK